MSKGFKIDLDLSEVIQEFSLSSSQARAMGETALADLTQAIHREWTQAARRGLNSTRQQYIRGLQIVSIGYNANAIILKGKFNNMLEAGVSSFDMKLGFSRSAKIKISKKGNWYLTIPFRHATPGALGENEAFSGVLPKPVYKAIRDSEAIGNKSLQKDEIPKAFAAAGKNKTSGYEHKHSIYEGVQRTEKFYEETTQGQYTSFRRVGAKSNPKAFIHSGIKQGRFADKALENLDAQTIVDNAIDNFLTQT